MDEDREYDVGYGRPPKASQFKKGKSGNPRGRPRRDLSMGALFRKVSQQKVRTNTQNGQKMMTKMEASLIQLVNKSASGDLKALKVLVDLSRQFPELSADCEPLDKLVLEVVYPKHELSGQGSQSEVDHEVIPSKLPW
jgi:hypothetical protein